MSKRTINTVEGLMQCIYSKHKKGDNYGIEDYSIFGDYLKRLYIKSIYVLHIYKIKDSSIVNLFRRLLFKSHIEIFDTYFSDSRYKHDFDNLILIYSGLPNEYIKLNYFLYLYYNDYIHNGYKWKANTLDKFMSSIHDILYSYIDKELTLKDIVNILLLARYY